MPRQILLVPHQFHSVGIPRSMYRCAPLGLESWAANAFIVSPRLKVISLSIRVIHLSPPRVSHREPPSHCY
jgi:hypothetical protein